MIHFNFFEGNSVYCSLSSHLVCHFISASVVASSPSQSSPKSGRLNGVQKAGKEAALGSSVWADFFTLKSDGSAVGPRTDFREALLRLGVAVLGSSLALGVPQSHASLPGSGCSPWTLRGHSLSPLAALNVIWHAFSVSLGLWQYTPGIFQAASALGHLGKEIRKRPDIYRKRNLRDISGRRNTNYYQ